MSPLLRILALFRAQIFWLALGLICTVAGAIAAVALSGSAGAVFASASLLAVPFLLRALGPIRVVLRYFERLVTHDALFRALADLRVWFFRGLAVRVAGGLGMARTGDVLSRLVGDVEAQDVVYMRIVLPLACAALLLPLMTALLAGYDLTLAAIVGVLFVLAAFVLPWRVAQGALAGGSALSLGMSGLRVAVLDSVVGLREIRAFAAEGRMLALVQGKQSLLLAAQSVASNRMARAGAMAFLCGQAAVLAVLLMGRGYGNAAVPLVFVVIAAFEAVALLPRAGAQAGSASAAAARVLEVAEAPVLHPDPAHPAALAPGHTLRFENVSFGWSADRPLVFDGLSLDVPAGTRIALLGPSGVGKSSLAALALRMTVPDRGRILLGGVDIATLAAVDLRHQIGWLSQATHLFDDSIRANLLLARPDAAEDELWLALEQAQIADAVRALPDGLEAYLGEGGHRFSGGQARRIVLARTLLSTAKVLILDEPCAGLDAQTEREFLATLNTAANGRSIILIAHRLTGVEKLDRIFRLSGGRAVAAAG